MKIEKDLYSVIKTNSKDELKKFLISNGKGPKAICPVTFEEVSIKDEKENNNE